MIVIPVKSQELLLLKQLVVLVISILDISHICAKLIVEPISLRVVIFPLELI
jgi:hypothetical protein